LKKWILLTDFTILPNKISATLELQINVESLKILEILKIAKFIDFEKFKIIKHSDF